MKKVGLMVLVQLMLFSFGFSQKSKVKERGKPKAETTATAQDTAKANSGGGKAAIRGASVAQDTTNKDSLRGKAAIRGTANMQAARDSLRGADFSPPVDVVDTFEVIREFRPGQTKLRRAQLEAAEKRLAEIREMLEKAGNDLEKAREEKTASAAQIEELSLRIDAEMERLEISEAKIKTLREDWLEKTGLNE